MKFVKTILITTICITTFITAAHADILSSISEKSVYVAPVAYQGDLDDYEADTGMMLGVSAHVPLSAFNPSYNNKAVTAGLSLEYTATSIEESVSEYGYSVTIEADVTTINLIPSLKYKTQDLGSFGSFVEGGIGLSLQTIDVDGGESLDSSNPAIALSAGLEKNRFEFVLKYMTSLGEVDDSEVGIDYFALTTGYHF